ncbi:MAG: DUF6966 domain-containing protein [Paracoccaceae bacterium]
MTHDLSHLHPDVREFVICLNTIEQMLAADNEHFWRRRIQKVIEIARNSDGYSVELFLGMFGGMGSFNDLVLNGSAVANSAFFKERSRASEIALKLR